MKITLVQMVDRELIATVTDEDNVISVMEIRGCPFTKLNAHPSQRAEL